MKEENGRWGRVLAGAVLGCATGISALLLYTNGLFVAGLARDFGLTRTQFGFGVLLVTLALAAANPLVGWAVDRFSARTPAIIGLVLLSLGFAAMGTLVSSVNSYLVIQAAVAFVGAASGPIAYTKIIGATFDKNRGVALGVTMTGIGISAAAVPPSLAWIISNHGWRAGFFSLALVPLVGALATALLIPRRSSAPAAGAPPASAAPSNSSENAGLDTAGSWIRSPVFWMMAVAFAMMAISFAGLLPHFVPMLIDGGLTPVAAGGIAGEIGLAVIASRLFVGFLLDRVFAPRIAIAICVLAASGFVILIVNGMTSASITAITLGFAMGAELDLMGFLVARYFGLREFGRIYGWLYGAFIFASGLGPLWVGGLRDATGNYTLALEISTAGLLLACVGFVLLPRYEPAVTVRPGRTDFAEPPAP